MSHSRCSTWVAAIVLITFIGIVICCACLNGFRYEAMKFKAFLTTLTLIFIYQFFFADAIFIVLKATLYAIIRRVSWTGEINPIFIGEPNRKEFLKRRIAALKSQLELGPTFYKRNEARTIKFKEILNDLILFGGYLFILLILVIGTRDSLLYYTNRVIKEVIRNPKFSRFAIGNIVTSDDVYNFINGTVINGFNDGTSYNGKQFAECGWTNLQIAKVLGVIRLRQIRRKSLSETSDFETDTHAPGWLKNVPPLPYKEKFWRIFKPWQYQDEMDTGGVGWSGKIYHQPGGGYVTLLGRNAINSRRVLEFLRKNNWIDRYTAVIVIEFNLYNVDGDVFTLVTISAEQTAFNSFVVTDKIDSMKLLFNIDNLPWFVLVTFLLYFLVLMRVLGYVIGKMWYSPSVKDYLSVSWNYVDITIVVLNMFIGFGVWFREVYVKKLLLQLESSKRNEFVPFYRAALIDETCTMLIAFLIALTTIRLWKILQFARVFRVLTSTLHHAKGPLASTSFFIGVFLTGIGLGSFIINGCNSSSFAEFIKSITTLMSLSFGFGATVTPSELNYGGRVVGFILYALLAIAVTVFLLNMFISVVCLNFTKERAKDHERSMDEDYYTFWHFLEMEFYENCRLLKRKKHYFKDDNTLRLRGGGSRPGKQTDVSDSDNARRIELISEILETQIELLKEYLDVEIEEDGTSVHSNENIEQANRELSSERDTSTNVKLSRKNRRCITKDRYK